MISQPRVLMVVAVLAFACGENKGGTGTKIAGMTEDGAAPPAPGQEAGPPGTRGGGGGAFGGGDPDASAPATDADLPPADAPRTMADARPDLARDGTLTPADVMILPADTAVPVDTADPCASASACDGYETDYQMALVRARSCNPTVKLQCQMTAATGLKCGGCKVWVNSTAELTAIRNKWLNAGCQTCKVLCPAIACRALTTGVCHSKMLAAPDPGQIAQPPVVTGTCIDQSDPVPF